LINSLLIIIDKLKTKKEYIEYIKKYIYSNELIEHSTKVYLDRLSYISMNKYNELLTQKEKQTIIENCWNKDYLCDFEIEMKFDIVIGNPPYLGTKSLGKNYLLKLKNIFGFTDDLYALFTYKVLKKQLKENHFFSFVTSNTYLTLKTKKYLREELISNGLYKVISNNQKNFKIKTSTTTFFVSNNQNKETIEIYEQNDDLYLNKVKELKIKEINKEYQLPLLKDNEEISNAFNKVKSLYEKYEKEIGTTKKLEKFKKTKEYKKLLNEKYLPLGLVSFIATGIDFKGNNKKVLYSIKNKKHNIIEDKENIREVIKKEEFTKGLLKGKYIKAIKGKELLYVLWNKETFDYLKKIKAPLRNLSLYGDSELLYCKTSTYEFNIVDENTLCINTAGACFIKPIMDISIKEILKQINKEEIKEYLKNNINNSLCFTPNDLKLIPLKIN